MNYFWSEVLRVLVNSNFVNFFDADSPNLVFSFPELFLTTVFKYLFQIAFILII